MKRKIIRVAAVLGLVVVGLVPATIFAAMVDINSADARALDRVLVGVGPAKAAAIVEYRKNNGPFGSADDLVKVRGIGPKTVEKNRARIRVDGTVTNSTGSDRATEQRPMVYRVAPPPRW